MTENKDQEVVEKKALTVPPELNGIGVYGDAEKFDLIQRVGKMFAESSLVPDTFKGKTADCVIAVNLAGRMGVDPFSLMQNMYVVHGKPGLEGKFVIALINGCGRFEPVQFEMEGSGKTQKGIPRPKKCVAYARHKKTEQILRGPAVTWEMAEAEGWTKSKGTQISKWQTIPELMFRYRAGSFFGKTYCPDVLMGMQTKEEIEDIVDLHKDGDGTYKKNDGVKIEDIIDAEVGTEGEIIDAESIKKEADELFSE